MNLNYLSLYLSLNSSLGCYSSVGWGGATDGQSVLESAGGGPSQGAAAPHTDEYEDVPGYVYRQGRGQDAGQSAGR